MQVFISEYLVGGASMGGGGSESMRREGLAMLQAVIPDIARLPGWSVVTTLDHSIAWQPDCEVIRVDSAAREAEIFAEQVDRADAVLVIAPETNQILANRCRQVRQNLSWNCSVAAIELCGDKLALAEHLVAHDLATIDTALLTGEAPPPDLDWPVVIKPRDGAGSTMTFLIRHSDDWSRVMELVRHDAGETDFLCQPFVPGRTLSIAVNISLNGRHLQTLPVAEQHLAEDRFRYLGGAIPANLTGPESSAVTDLVLRTCGTIPGLRGYVGFDLILKPDGCPVLVEINPRLTTSYVGYRQLFAESLPGFWLGMTEPLRTAERSITIRV